MGTTISLPLMGYALTMTAMPYGTNTIHQYRTYLGGRLHAINVMTELLKMMHEKWTVTGIVRIVLIETTTLVVAAMNTSAQMIPTSLQMDSLFVDTVLMNITLCVMPVVIPSIMRIACRGLIIIVIVPPALRIDSMYAPTVMKLTVSPRSTTPITMATAYVNTALNYHTVAALVVVK